MRDPLDPESPALQELRSRPHWVCWRKERRKGKVTKVPYDPKTGKRAESNNPATWAGYEEAVQKYEQSSYHYDGIGVMFVSGGNITGIDLDHCLHPDHTIEPWAQRIIDQMASWSEYSPSETGVHILVHGSIPKGIRRRIEGASHPEAAVEMYCQGRYFTVTGKHLAGTSEQIENRQEALEKLYHQISTKGTPSQTPSERAVSPESAGTAFGLVDDEDLLKRACAATNGEKFRALFYEGAKGYPSQSEADMALCLLLAFWTGRDTGRMDHLFRRSALYREKWESPRSEHTYGWETIQKAATLCQAIYTPRHTQQQLEHDITRLLTHVAQGQARTGTRQSRPFQLAPRPVEARKILEYLDMNEYGDALFFASVFEGQVCYDHTNGEWYLWQGHSWKQDSTGKVRQLVAGVLGSLYLRAAADLNTEQAELDLKIQTLQRESATAHEVETLKSRSKELAGQMGELAARAKALRSAKRNHNVQAFIQSEMGMTAEMWDIHPWMLPVLNGVIDLRSGIRQDGHPEDYIRTVAPTEWMGLETPSPRFEQFLQEIFEEKADRDALIAFLQRLLGYGITGLTTLALFPILYGQEGRNGKDTLLGVLHSVLGALVGPVSNDVFVAQDKLRTGGAATPHLCDLQGKRLVWGSETREGDRLNIAQIKQLTGGGDISARKPYGQQYSFAPTHKLLLMTNYKPHADARDKAFWSRACLIEFDIRFVDRPKAKNERKADPGLREALKHERSGILAWLVRGCLAWQKQGLAIPESILLSTNRYRDEEDKVLQFIQECCLVAPGVSVRAGSLYEAYRKWSEANQYGRGMNNKLFGDEISKTYEKKRAKTGIIYQGIGLLSQEEGLFEAVESGVGCVASGVGSGEDDAQPYTTPEGPPEAVSKNIDEGIGVGCVGCSQELLPHAKNGPTRKGVYGKTLHTLHQASSVNVANPLQKADESRKHHPQDPTPILHQPYTDPTHPTPDSASQACVTRFEKFHDVRHEAQGVHFSAGCWWCDRCIHQRAFLEIGERINYPALMLAYRGKASQVRAGREQWLKVACDGGDGLVAYARGVAQSQEAQSLRESQSEERGSGRQIDIL